MTRSLTHKYI